MTTAKKAADKPAETSGATADGVGQVDEVVNPGQVELQKTVDRAEERGFLGVEVDATPDHHYSVAGVTAGKSTPETDRGQG